MEFNQKEAIQKEKILIKVLVMLGVILVMLVLGYLAGKGIYSMMH